MARFADQRLRPRLTVAMIARDEQETLSESIASVRAIADHVVVLDTGSHDQTIACAQRLGAQVGQMPWCDSFSVARNRCLDMVTDDWVLWLNAGECLTADSAPLVRRFIDQQAEAARAYLMMVELPAEDPTASNEQMAQLRLAPNHPSLRFTGRVNETLEPSMGSIGLQRDAAPGRILGHIRHNDAMAKTRRAQLHRRLAEMEIAETSGRPPLRLYLTLAEVCSELGDRSRARQAFLDAIQDAPAASTEMLQAYYGLLYTYEGEPAKADLRVSTCLTALDIFPLDCQLLLAMSHYLHSKGRDDLTLRCLELAVRFGKTNPETWHLVELAEVAAVCLSASLRTQGRDEEARHTLEDARQRSPQSWRLGRSLLDLLIQQHNSEEALHLLDSLPLPPDQRKPFREAVRGACHAAAQNWTAALGHLQSAYVGGCHDSFCLRWLAVTLLTNGQTEAAVGILQQWHRREPANAELQAYLAAVAHQPPQPSAGVPSEGKPHVDSGRRHLRFDPGCTCLEMTPPIAPIISQASSADL